MSDEPRASYAEHSKLGHRRLVLLSVSLVAAAILAFVFARNLIDFPVYYAAGQSLIGGRTDLYASDFARGRVMDYRYPPLFLVSLIPLWLLPYRVAAFVWCLLSIGEVGACVIVLRRLVRIEPARRWIWAASLLASAQYVVMILHYGNAHLLATSLLFIALYLAIRRRPVIAALLLALSITIKLTPVLVLPYFALKRQWRTLALVVVFLAALNVGPSAYFGFGQNSALLGTWFKHVIVDQEFHEENGPINLSLKGQLKRYFSAVDYSRRVDGDTAYPAVNVGSIASSRLDGVWLAVAFIAFLSGLTLVGWRAKGAALIESRAGAQDDPADSVAAEGETVLDQLELGLMICLMLFVGPLTSKIYFIALLWPLVCLAGIAYRDTGRASSTVRYLVAGLAITNVVLPLLPGRSIQRLLLVLGVDFYVNFLLMAGLAYVLMRTRRAPERSTGEASKQSRLPARTS